jgi:hypothetical protein
VPAEDSPPRDTLHPWVAVAAVSTPRTVPVVPAPEDTAQSEAGRTPAVGIAAAGTVVGVVARTVGAPRTMAADRTDAASAAAAVGEGSPDEGPACTVAGVAAAAGPRRIAGAVDSTATERAPQDRPRSGSWRGLWRCNPPTGLPWTPAAPTPNHRMPRDPPEGRAPMPLTARRCHAVPVPIGAHTRPPIATRRTGCLQNEKAYELLLDKERARMEGSR